MANERVVNKVTITTLVHATEDETKVSKSIQTLFPKDANVPPFTRATLKGYFGDPITTIKVQVKNRRPASDLFDNLLKHLSSLDVTDLIEGLPQRIDESNNLYLRFDKQKACQGKIVLSSHDALKVKIRLQLPHKADPVPLLTGYIEAKTL